MVLKIIENGRSGVFLCVAFTHLIEMLFQTFHLFFCVSKTRQLSALDLDSFMELKDL